MEWCKIFEIFYTICNNYFHIFTQIYTDSFSIKYYSSKVSMCSLHLSCQGNIMWSVNFCKTIKNDLKSTKEVQNLRTTHKVNYHGLLLLHLISPPPLYMITFSPSFNYIPTRIKFLYKDAHPPNFCMNSNTGALRHYLIFKNFHVQIFLT